jgi:Tfp pilus assembly protein PilO
MKKYFEQLRPMERRLVVGVAVVLFIVLNAVFIWPHFSDWDKLSRRLDDARRKLKLYQEASAQIPALQADVKKFASAGQTVAPEDQAIDLMRAIQSQAAASGFGIQNFSRSLVRTNDAFFVEQVQNITVVAKEDQLVDFLYKLGSGGAMIRVRDLVLQPDPPRQRLSASILLVASYQKNSQTAPAAKKTSTAKAK